MSVFRLLRPAAVVAVAALVPAALPATAKPVKIFAAEEAPVFRIVELGTLPGDESSVAAAVNDHGLVVGSSTGPATYRRAFVWRAGRMTELAGLGGNTQANDVNNRGDVVGASAAAGAWEQHAVLWRAGRLVDLGTLGGASSWAEAVNDDGVVVGTSETADGGMHVFSWRRGVMTDLGDAGGVMTRGADVNDDGVVSGERVDDAMASAPVLWRRGRAAVLPVEGAATGVDDRGQVVGYTSVGVASSFVWSPRGVTRIAPPAGGTFLQMQALSDRGDVVGHGDAGAYLWRAGRLTRLPALVGTSASAWDVNEAGVIVGGSATTPDGLGERAVLWTR